MLDHDILLMAHLMRRAGFGATLKQIDEHVSRGYEATVEDLITATDRTQISDDLIRRYHNEQSGMLGFSGAGAYWTYRMISSQTPLLEKIAFFWHNIFATGYPGKVNSGKVLSDQIRMFRTYGMGSFRTLLLELAKDPAMICWLDNRDNHKDAINENFGRELLELFSMGVGNYTELDVKECARAFTGWNIGNSKYMSLKANRDSIWPYGRIAFHFEYNSEDHDDGQKQFLGRTGRFDGDDIVQIICEQLATARFIARHMYHFFVADEPPVPQWPYVAPRDPEAIETLSTTYFESGYDISAMLRVLFNSDFFKSEESWYEKVKSPAELVAGVLRLSGEFNQPKRTVATRYNQMIFMGQALNNPPSVEGWHQGKEWIGTGNLVERLNFASEQLSDWENLGSREIIQRVVDGTSGRSSPESLVDGCLDELGALLVSAETRSALVEFASKDLDTNINGRVSQIMQLVVASPEFQRA